MMVTFILSIFLQDRSRHLLRRAPGPRTNSFASPHELHRDYGILDQRVPARSVPLHCTRSSPKHFSTFLRTCWDIMSAPAEHYVRQSWNMYQTLVDLSYQRDRNILNLPLLSGVTGMPEGLASRVQSDWFSPIKFDLLWRAEWDSKGGSLPTYVAPNALLREFEA